MSLKYPKAKTSNPVRYPYDCERIVKVLRSKGYGLSLHEAERMWESHSDSYCAGWLILPDIDQEIIDALIE
jgi:hypothetical protein